MEGEETWKLMIGSVTKTEGEETWKLMIGSVTKNGGRREWKLMIGSVTKNGGRREMETYDRICDQNGGGREMYQRFENLPKLKEDPEGLKSKKTVKVRNSMITQSNKLQVLKENNYLK